MAEVVEHGVLAAWVQHHAAGTDRYLFGIAGPPGCGKSTLAARLAAELHAPVVAMDAFHLPNRTLVDRGLLDTKGAPETFAANEFVDLVRRLRTRAGPVLAPAFDRVADEPVPDAVLVEPTDRVVIIEGNYLLLDEPPWSALPAVLDAVGFVDLDHEVRIARLVSRHVEYGKSIAVAAEFVQRSDERNAARVEACRERAAVFIT